MAIELSEKTARGLMHYVIGRYIRPEDVEAHCYGDSRRYTTEKGIFRIYVENDYLHKDGRIRVGVQDKLSGEKLERIFTPSLQEDFRTQGTERLQYDRERREYWIRTVGVEAAKAEIDEMWRIMHQGKPTEWYKKTPAKPKVANAGESA